MKNQSKNPYKYFEFSEIEQKLYDLLKDKSTIKVMEKLVEYGIPPVGAITKEAEEIYNDACTKTPSLKNRQHDFNKYFGYLVGQEMEKRGYKKTGSRGKIKGKFFRTGTKFIKSSEKKTEVNESVNPFSRLAGIVKIGKMSNEELDNVIYAS